MPIIQYKTQQSVYRFIKGKNRWVEEYELIKVEVSEEIARFLEHDDKREKR